MTLRLPLVGLAVILAMGAAIYFGLEAGGPDAKSPLPLVAAPASKSEANKKLLTSAFKGAPNAFPVMDSAPAARPAPAMAASSSASAAQAPASGQAMNQEQILAALQALDSLADGPDKTTKRHELVALYAALDPQATLDYVNALTGDERGQLQSFVLGEWAGKDPAGAAAHFRANFLTEANSIDDNRRSAGAIAKAWAGQDTGAAWSWVATLPEDVRSQATGAVVAKMAENDPQAALHAVKSIASPAERAEAMSPLAEQWAQSAPVVAAAWVSGLRDPSEQNNAAAGLVSGWMLTSPKNASTWVSQLPAGDTRDAAIAAMVQAPTAMKSPEAALTWAAGIQNLELRNQMLPQVLQQWQAQDPAGAEQFIEKLKRTAAKNPGARP